MYGKLIDGALHFAPKKLPGNGVNVWNAPAEMYLAQDWKPVVFTEAPDDPPAGYYYEGGWEEQAESIVQTWTLAELPEDIEEKEAFDIIFGGGE